MEKELTKIKLLESEIKLKNIEISELRKKIFEEEFKLMQWDDLENWLRKNRPENNYEKNPTITSGYGDFTTYCKLTNEGELQIGAYYHNDRYPRGKKLYVSFKNYR